jgi:hypothetical protein
VRRTAALVVAIGLIVGALIIRNHRDTEKRLGPYRLTCATEFAPECRTLSASEVSVTVEPAGVTTDRLVALPAGADPGFDGWLSAGVWPRIVTQARAAAGAASLGATTLDLGGAHSRLVIVGWRDRLTVLRQACRGQLTWKCIGDAAAKVTWKANGGPEAWGPVKIALPDPATESVGLATLAGASFDPLLAGLSPADAASNDAYLRWLTAVAQARSMADLAAILTSGPALADIYVGFAAEVEPIVRTSAARDQVEITSVAIGTDVAARLLAIGRQPPAKLADALRKSGWTRVATTGAMPLMPDLVPALRQLWKDTVR